VIKKFLRRTPLGWLQLSHDRGRLVVALAGIAFADLLMFMQLGFQGALFDSNTRVHRSFDADLVLISPQARNIANMASIPRRRLYQAMNLPGVESAQPVYVSFTDWKNPQTRKTGQVLVFGVSPSQPVFTLPEVNKHLDQIKLPDTVLFDRGARGEYTEAFAQIDRGQPVKTEIGRRTITVTNLFQIGASFAADGSLITSDQNFLRLFPRRQAEGVSFGLLRLQAGQNPEQIAAKLQKIMPPDVRVLTLPGFVEFEKDYWQRNTSIGFVFSLGTVMGFVVGVVIVYQVLSTDVNDHIAEYATLKAMGYRNLYLLGVVFEEAIILALVGFVPGLAVSVGLYQLTRNATNLPIYMPVARALLVLSLTTVMCVLSGAIATRKLQSADPADIF
jgi:putative ABC transport system permease protein